MNGRAGTEELVAQAIHDVDCADVPHCMATPTTWSRYRRFAAVSVAALSDAGRLLPEGGEERTEKGYWNPATSEVQRWWSYHESGYKAPDRTRTVRTWPDGSTWTSGWSEVTE